MIEQRKCCKIAKAALAKAQDHPHTMETAGQNCLVFNLA